MGWIWLGFRRFQVDDKEMLYEIKCTVAGGGMFDFETWAQISFEYKTWRQIDLSNDFRTFCSADEMMEMCSTISNRVEGGIQSSKHWLKQTNWVTDLLECLIKRWPEWQKRWMQKVSAVRIGNIRVFDYTVSFQVEKKIGSLEYFNFGISLRKFSNGAI